MKKINNGIVALSSAAIIAVYTAGHARTRSAAEELDAASNQRRPGIPAPAAADAAAVAAPPEPGERRPAAAPEPAALTPAPEVSAPARPAAATQPKAITPSISPLKASPLSAAAPATVSGPVVAAPVLSPAAAAASVTSTGTSDTAAPATASEPAPVSPVKPVSPAKKAWKDGTYRAWGRSRHGDMLAFVVIENGRIVHSGVDKCETRWPCSIVAHLYPQVLQRQSAEVDYVSGATQSGNAFYYGIADALAMAEGAAVDVRPIPQ